MAGGWWWRAEGLCGDVVKMLVTVLSRDGGDTPRVCGDPAQAPDGVAVMASVISVQYNWPDQRMGLWFAVCPPPNSQQMPIVRIVSTFT